MPNDDIRRRALRAAVKIHEHLSGPARRLPLNGLPVDAWNEIYQTAERLRKVQRLGWQAASRHLVDDLVYMARNVQRHLELFETELSNAKNVQVVPTADMAADLVTLQQEFEELEIDLSEKKISVLTPPIVLEDFHLGPFEIVLNWEKIGQTRAYEVVAQEPCRPDNHENVTHPHVSDRVLCEGDGSAPIKLALLQGRLLDFFLLVRQILQTYNPGSAYVSLDTWNGVSCRGCGYSMSGDDSSSCDRCDDPLCSDCSWSCSHCYRYVCGECSGSCGQCDDRFCLACLSSPAGDDRLLCDKCLQAQQQETSNDSKDELQVSPPEEPSVVTATTQTPAPAPDPVCLGEAAVPPRPGRNGGRRVRRVSTGRPAARRRRPARAAVV